MLSQHPPIFDACQTQTLGRLFLANVFDFMCYEGLFVTIKT